MCVCERERECVCVCECVYPFFTLSPKKQLKNVNRSCIVNRCTVEHGRGVAIFSCHFVITKQCLSCTFQSVYASEVKTNLLYIHVLFCLLFLKIIFYQGVTESHLHERLYSLSHDISKLCFQNCFLFQAFC